MKKFMALLITAAMITILFTGCSAKTESADSKTNEPKTNVQSQNETQDEKIKIGIIQPVEHPSLNQIRESIISGLEELGLKDKVEITYKDAQGDPSNINTIISQFVGEEMDVIVPIATSTAQSAAAATSEIPIVFAAASYPVEAGLVKDLNKPEKNITGVSDAIDVKQIFDLAFELTPEIKTFGFIYNSGEVNSAAAIEQAKNYLDEKEIEYVEATITNSSELQQAAQSLAGKADAIFTPTDNTVASAMPVLSAEAINAGIPVYTGADSMVADGGFATVGVDYTVLGKQVADMVKRIIDGQEISEIPVETLKEYKKILNTTTAKSLGVEITDKIFNNFETVE